MAVYKVPQDVEAEDKLLGPFSFKQFIFLVIAVGSGGVAYALSRLSLPLAAIPLPFVIFFGTLALPLRKDQPMEVYLAALISFILKPKVRIWKPDGIESLIEVVAPAVDESSLGKNYSREEVQRRLSYLASVVDSRGWSVRGVLESENSMREELFNEAQAMDDPMDDGGNRSQRIDSLLAKVDSQRREQIANIMQHGSPQTQAHIQPNMPNMQGLTASDGQPLQVSPMYTPMVAQGVGIPDQEVKLVVNPYPIMSQSVISPLSGDAPAPQISQQQIASQLPQAQPVATAGQTLQQQPNNPQQVQPSGGEEPISPAIIDLARNSQGLSIQTLSREAEKIKEKESTGEVVISLR